MLNNHISQCNVNQYKTKSGVITITMYSTQLSRSVIVRCARCAFFSMTITCTIVKMTQKRNKPYVKDIFHENISVNASRLEKNAMHIYTTNPPSIKINSQCQNFLSCHVFDDCNTRMIKSTMIQRKNKTIWLLYSHCTKKANFW